MALIGVATAWLTTMHDFPRPTVFEWALVLPLAVPAYVMAYVYRLSAIRRPGPNHLREIFGWEFGDYCFPTSAPARCDADVRVRALPPTFILARTPHFSGAGRRRARSRTHPRHRAVAGLLHRVAAAGRPAIATGVALALMEPWPITARWPTFAVNTFTTGIYRAWFPGRPDRLQLTGGDPAGDGAAAGGRRAHHPRRARYHNTSNRLARPRAPVGMPGWLASLACLTPLPRLSAAGRAAAAHGAG